jgi:hypothetical protein
VFSLRLKKVKWTRRPQISSSLFFGSSVFTRTSGFWFLLGEEDDADGGRTENKLMDRTGPSFLPMMSSQSVLGTSFASIFQFLIFHTHAHFFSSPIKTKKCNDASGGGCYNPSEPHLALSKVQLSSVSALTTEKFGHE